jgi:hypothetical protein
VEPSGATSEWHFDAVAAVTADVPAAPVFDRYQAYFDLAIPLLAQADLSPPRPTLIVARVTAPVATGRKLPAGPRDRAKALMDALHDQRRKPPFYAERDQHAPLQDDNAHFVRGLAVEVRPGPLPRTEYRLGSDLVVTGRPLAQVDVDATAPNDIWVSPASRERIEIERTAFAAACTAAWPEPDPARLATASALVVRHHPGRDEDNTWSNWIGAITGRPQWSRAHWPIPPPLAAWRPTAIASVSDPHLPCATRFEVFTHEAA